ncbi:hypothetical protein GUITHDRAFT_115205 [Guillardia theta CCMP2712]|uniref:Ubiquitin-like domain-containing protein n=1 Tax=Guillardia theta (strain CCMP2712) TaxID=905079 RepID=L1IRC6_GUITC|nr:hypothetical protein GUITHDRAFT_115205 [Guillardia theta CCMP2712]EKX38657.1 hypothetical protein GUITHDRAFT_115205 [Guillardia theta CCMP2712]|eukprot:XP_005825637.1 hypothetical protein GUITHDRAFT_115205 [Guillardia theta CCMP2712]
MLVYIKWRENLEPLYCHETDDVKDVRRRVMTMSNVPVEHKLLVHHGLLLRDGMTLSQCGVMEDSTLFLVLNENPFKGRELFVKTTMGVKHTLFVRDDFKIEDLKDDVFAFPDEPPPENQVLLFVGKQLENDRTLREYNIQKESCLRVINSAFARNDIRTFIRFTSPSSNAINVSTDSIIIIQMTSIDEDETHYWGQLLGSPDLSSLLPQQVQLREKNSFALVPCSLKVDSWTRTVQLEPKRALASCSHYQVVFNRRMAEGVEGMRHLKCDKEVEGVARWSFFTEGYQPLRVLSLYPPPFSTVTSDGCRIAITFSDKLHPECVERGARDWVRVRTREGISLLDPFYDDATNTLVYDIGKGIGEEEVVRVKLLGSLILGAAGQSMLPMKNDGITKTSPFTWQFYVSKVTRD